MASFIRGGWVTALKSLLGFGNSKSVSPAKRGKRRPGLEFLEDRAVPAALGPVVSGFVFNDLNGNGIRDTGEAPIAGVTMELRTPAGVLVSTAVTDLNGQYTFEQDMSASSTQQTSSQRVSFDNLKGAWSGIAPVSAFDPALGTLTGVELRLNGQVTSSVKVENLDTDIASANIALNNSLFVLGPNGALQGVAPPDQYAPSLGAFDGFADFAGTSGFNSGSRTLQVSSTSQVASTGLSAWTGTQQINLRAAARGTSTQQANTNLMSSFTTLGRLDLDVVYTYLPSRALQVGNYQVIQRGQPTGWLDGPESIGSSPLPGTIGTDFINISLIASGISNVNFSEVRGSSIQGIAYIDAGGDAQYNSGDYGAIGSVVTLSGTNDTGASVNQQIIVGSDGRFAFTDVRPGTYMVTSSLLNKNAFSATKAGSLGGTVSTMTVSAIKVRSGDTGLDYQFGQYVPAGISGTVYADMNSNGVQDPGEAGIAGQTVRLTTGTGTSSVVTDANGDYSFGNLRPGTYSISNPTTGTWMALNARAGLAGGVVANNELIQQITLSSGTVGESYLFGKAVRSLISGTVYTDVNKNGIRDGGEAGLGGITVRLSGNNDLGQIVSLSTVTAADGSYSFSPLRSGSYTVTVATPSGYTSNAANPGTVGGTALSTSSLVVSLGTSQEANNYDFAMIQATVAVPLSKRFFLVGIRR